MDTPNLMGQFKLPRGTLNRQVAVVTGAGRGIGRESARALAWLGAKVVIAELNLVSGSETSTMIQREGGEAIFIQTDIANTESVAALAAKTHTAFGTVDILINCAMLNPLAPLSEMDVAQWDQVIAVNLRGGFLTCKVFLPEMLAKKHGVIVNMVLADAMPGLSAYSASKQGLTGFSQSLALEIGDQQGVSVIPFETGISAFDGVISAAYAGAATAYLVAALAPEYHGKLVTGYTLLERAGVLPSA